MPDKTLKGSGISKRSLETDKGVDFVPRYEAHYHCDMMHITIIPFSTEANIPPVWECRCGNMASLKNNGLAFSIVPKKMRTHWDMLMERRNEAELVELLDYCKAQNDSGIL